MALTFDSMRLPCPPEVGPDAQDRFSLGEEVADLPGHAIVHLGAVQDGDQEIALLQGLQIGLEYLSRRGARGRDLMGPDDLYILQAFFQKSFGVAAPGDLCFGKKGAGEVDLMLHLMKMAPRLEPFSSSGDLGS